ncbi:DNA methyltransferase [Cupriavidus taiwanensis]|uniref:DNA methyltransferase n=1 Tax=Cupriavidus taiwanensis TaxID=164546 RepID=UPI000E2FC584|nr:DNA methyltransferase [Cupriavidus taiwanensis]
MSRSLAYEPRYALNAICPYFTMFPLEYPLRVLRKHRNDSPVVMDPFCGRGTTLFAARALGLASRGIDSSPIAIAIARAKLCKVQPQRAIELAQHFIANIEPVDVPDTEFFRAAFTPAVLKAVCAIREGLLGTSWRSNSAVLLRAAMLGCLHGPTNKRPETQAYFSNQMPRTFSSKPDYSVRYWKSKGLKAPAADVIEVLSRKLMRFDETSPPSGVTPSRAVLGDSRSARSLPARSRDFSVVVTSPPYYGMTTYVEDQWLRNWLLGGASTVNYGNSEQLEHTGKDVFAKSLGSVWRNMALTRTDSLDMYIRFGIIPSTKVDAKALMLASLEESGVKWKMVHTREAETAASGKRQADLMAAGSTAALEYDFHVRRI